jgi:hypothetical protein
MQQWGLRGMQARVAAPRAAAAPRLRLLAAVAAPAPRTLPRRAAAAAPGAPEMTEEERAALRQSVERAAQALDEIVEEVGREVFVSEAAAYIYRCAWAGCDWAGGRAGRQAADQAVTSCGAPRRCLTIPGLPPRRPPHQTQRLARGGASGRGARRRRAPA